jgi:hypothetical protein
MPTAHRGVPTWVWIVGVVVVIGIVGIAIKSGKTAVADNLRIGLYVPESGNAIMVCNDETQPITITEGEVDTATLAAPLTIEPGGSTLIHVARLRPIRKDRDLRHPNLLRLTIRTADGREGLIEQRNPQLPIWHGGEAAR